MRIAFLGSAHSWYLQDLQRAAAGRCEILPVSFQRLGAEVSGTRSEIWSASGRLDEFDCVLVRSMPPGTLEQVVFRMNALANLADAGTIVINPPRSLEIAIDKYLALTRLQQAGLAVPKTVVCQDYQQAMESFDRLGGDVVVKPLFGGEGRGLIRISEEGLAHRAFRSLEQLHGVFYLQEFIEHEGHDIRLLTIGNKCFGISRHNGGDWRTNISQGGRAQPIELTDRLREVAGRAAAAVGAQLGALDLLPARDGTLYALEINGVPGWRALQRVLPVDIAFEILLLMEQAVEAGQTK